MRNNLGQVVHTYVPLSPSSINLHTQKLHEIVLFISVGQSSYQFYLQILRCSIDLMIRMELTVTHTYLFIKLSNTAAESIDIT